MFIITLHYIIDRWFYCLLIEARVYVDSILRVQLNEINHSVNIKAFYYVTVYCATIVL